MRQTAQACLDLHLADKLKTPNVVPAADWFESAERHHRSATSIINDDPAGALQMAWSAMHDIAKGTATAFGFRLKTGGRVARLSPTFMYALSFVGAADGRSSTRRSLGPGLVPRSPSGPRLAGRLYPQVRGGVTKVSLSADRHRNPHRHPVT